jgi:hypothetical protein
MMPSLACDTELDFSIKAPLVADSLNIVGLKPLSDNWNTIVYKEPVNQRGGSSTYVQQFQKK